MKNNPIFTVIYIVLIIFIIFFSFYLLKILYNISILPLINDTFGALRDYVIYNKQPAMFIPILIYDIINVHPLHIVYAVILCCAAFALIVILVCWLIGLILKNIIFTNPFAKIPPWSELNELGFFEWFFEKTMLDKNKDIIRFVLNIFRSVMNPEEYAAAEQRCLEGFADKKTSSKSLIPLSHDEYINYNLENIYEEDERDTDIFYRGSYLSIKQRGDANTYRNMNIDRPDITATIPNIPDIDNLIKTEMNYMNIKLN